MNYLSPKLLFALFRASSRLKTIAIKKGRARSSLLLVPFVMCAELPAGAGCEPRKGTAWANRGANWEKATSVYDFSYVDIDGNVQSMEKYKGKVLIIINTASKCDLSQSNFTQLVAMYNKYSETHGLAILAFPSNQFGRQEPWDEPEIKEHLQSKYKVQFDLARKVEVNGDKAHPLFKWLKKKEPGCWWFVTSRISWNFNKFLIDPEGHVVKRYTPKQEPYEILVDICNNYWFDPPPCPAYG